MFIKLENGKKDKTDSFQVQLDTQLHATQIRHSHKDTDTVTVTVADTDADTHTHTQTQTQTQTRTQTGACQTQTQPQMLGARHRRSFSLQASNGTGSRSKRGLQ